MVKKLEMTEELSDHLMTIGVKGDRHKKLFHLFALGKSNTKVFYTGEGWTEDINARVETDDIIFAYETLTSVLDTEEERDDLLSQIIF